MTFESRQARRIAVGVLTVALLTAGTSGAQAKAKAKVKTKRTKGGLVATKNGTNSVPAQNGAVKSTKLGTEVASPNEPSAIDPRFSFSVDQVVWERREEARLGLGWAAEGPLSEILVNAVPVSGTPSNFRLPVGDIVLTGLNPFVDYSLEVTPVWGSLGTGRKLVFKVPAGTKSPRPANLRPEGLKGVALMGPRPNPCVPLHWTYNPAREPFDALPEVTDAVNTLAKAMGIDAIYDGTTSQYTVSLGQYDVYQSDTEFPRTALLVQWEDPAKPLKDYGENEKSVLGAGSPGVQRARPGLPIEFADGATLTLRDKLIGVTPAVLRSTLLHELGHTAGLAHVDDETSIMYPFAKGLANYSSSDLAALAALGRPGAGSCTA